MSKPFIATLAMVMILAASAAYASDGCPIVLDEKTYEAEGGILKFSGPHKIQHPPNDFFCDNTECAGAVQFEGTVNTEGAIHNLHVVRNTWTIEPEYHARISQENIYGWRYMPPKLSGKAVCVKMGWNIEYRIIDKAEPR